VWTIFARLSQRCVTKSYIPHEQRWQVFVALLCYLLLHTPNVWGDYLLTLKSGFQIRVQSYRVDASIIQAWTEYGSMELPVDRIERITELQLPAILDLPPATTSTPAPPNNEQTHEVSSESPSRSSLYIPDANNPLE
jgi:hypothetical protein